MHIGVDLDDVLGDYTGAWAGFSNRVYGTNLVRTSFTKFDWKTILGITQEDLAMRIEVFHRSDEFRGIQPVHGAQEGIKSLAEKHELFLVSSRKQEDIEKTTKWLDQYFPQAFSSVLHLGSGSEGIKKSRACFGLQIPLLIDDSLEVATDCVHAGTRVVLLDTPWNRQSDLSTNLIARARTWEEVNKIIASMELFRYHSIEK